MECQYFTWEGGSGEIESTILPEKATPLDTKYFALLNRKLDEMSIFDYERENVTDGRVSQKEDTCQWDEAGM